MKRELGEAQRVLDELQRQGVKAASLCADSRAAAPGDVFVAFPGARVDGRRFIADAVARGAAAVLWERQGAEAPAIAVPNLAVDDLQALSGWIAHLAYGRPSETLWTVGITGTNGKTTTVRLIAHLLQGTGLRTGMTCTDGVYVNDRRLDTGDCSGPKSARNVLMHPDVDAAVFETARGGLLREGLAFDRCKVAVVTNIGEGDHLGLNYITTVEDLAVLKRVIVQNVAPDGMAVLNAADPIVAKMAKNCPGAVTYFAADRHHPVMATHNAQGKRVVYIDGQSIVCAEGGEVVQQIPLENVPLTRKGTISFQVENAMASVAAAWALNLDWSAVRAALKSFASDADTAPGRFNVFGYRGATLIADYGHNPDAILALVRAVEAMPAERRMIVISGAGDRRDEDIRQQTEILGDAFDEVILYQDQCQRGRADGEVLGLLREGLANAKRATAVEEIRGEFLAIDTALARLQPGELCLILIDQVEEALAHIAGRLAEVSIDRPAKAAAQGEARLENQAAA